MKNVILSKKLTFSLTSLVVLIAFGLICGVPSVVAHDGKDVHIQINPEEKKPSVTHTHIDGDFKATLIAAESMMDVSYRGDGAANNIQIMRAAAAENTTISLLARFNRVVNLDDPTDAARQGTAVETDVEDRGTGAFEGGDVIIDAYDEDGRALGILPVAEADDVIELRHRDPNNPGREFLILIDEGELSDAYSDIHSGGPFMIATLLVSIPAGKVQDASQAAVRELRTKGHIPHSNTWGEVFTVNFVMADDGDPKWNTLAATPADPDAGTPGVVSIDRILSRSGFTPIEAGNFNVRVILTEEPRMGDKSGLTPDMIQVDVVGTGGGKAVRVTPGVTYKGGANDTNAGSELTLAIVGEYIESGGSVADALTDLPNATGRDNKYYSYNVEIEPDHGADGDLTVSIKSFMDHVKPVSNMYLPVTREQRVATTLSDNASNERDARVANETLTVRVHRIEDEKIEAAMAAYDARQEALNLVGNELVLGNKNIIPAGGYLVIVVDRGAAGIDDPKSKTAEKLTAAHQAYNVWDPGDNMLPFPADDLSNFFRNGGTLKLGYADIPEATGSGHADSGGPTGGDATGYTAATTNAYTKGALLINEIMWGLDGADKKAQYIELHNPNKDAAVGIDNKEWVITVGDLPTGFTEIDTVSNNQGTSVWEVPGADGVSTIQPDSGFFTLADITSMSRVDGGADGTMAASWAASIRPSANLSGRRIGTPGAANKYDTSAKDAAAAAEAQRKADAAAASKKADVATGADIMISEIMIDSNGGRLPQWIELSNVSGKEVSLMGWSIDIDNDSADADVVGETVNVEIGDVTVDKDQVVLVISKASERNSGVGTGKGDLRADRIVDAQSQLSPNDARYSMISEMAFKVALLPPQTGGVVERGDVVGNLDQGWELPTAEGNRHSLIRREMDMGTDAAGWMPAPVDLAGAYRTTYYGDDEDVGTPGYDAGGPLPVELSKFTAARDRVTGQVVIAWETQSELNNAGFFIKRSQQRNGQFVVVNPTMIAGAGTTSEKQSYTYTDTTAKPNIVYYYQIEDVSLDGNRQTLTRGHRLKGHIGAAGKATTTWGELKTSREQ